MDREWAGYSPWGHKESDRTEQLTLSLSFIVYLQCVLVSVLQQSEPIIHNSLFFGLPSHLRHRRALSTVPCAIQQVSLVIYF